MKKRYESIEKPDKLMMDDLCPYHKQQRINGLGVGHGLNGLPLG